MAGSTRLKVVAPSDRAPDLRRNLAEADAERADAVRQLQELGDMRSALVATEDAAALAIHDRRMEDERRRVEIADARHARLVAEVERADREDEQQRRRELLKRGRKAQAEARRIMDGEYIPAALAVASILERVAAQQAIVREANASLPDDADPLDASAEPFNGRHFSDGNAEEIEVPCLFDRMTGEPAPAHIVSGPNYEMRTRRIRRPVPLHPAAPHRPIAAFVNLPGLTPESYVYAAPAWGQPR